MSCGFVGVAHTAKPRWCACPCAVHSCVRCGDARCAHVANATRARRRNVCASSCVFIVAVASSSASFDKEGARFEPSRIDGQEAKRTTGFGREAGLNVTVRAVTGLDSANGSTGRMGFGSGSGSDDGDYCPLVMRDAKGVLQSKEQLVQIFEGARKDHKFGLAVSAVEELSRIHTLSLQQANTSEPDAWSVGSAEGTVVAHAPNPRFPIAYGEMHGFVNDLSRHVVEWKNTLRALQVMERHVKVMRLSSYALVARALRDAGRPEELAAMLTRMWAIAREKKANGFAACEPDEKMCCLAADLAAEQRNVGLARDIISEMESHGVKAGPYAYAALIKAYGRSGNDVGVERTLQRMHTQRVQPDQVALNAAIDALVRCKKVKRAQKLLSSMPAEWSVQPNVRSYNTVMKGLAELGLVDEAFALRKEMLDLGLEPSKVTRNTLLLACVNGNAWVRAQKLVFAIKSIDGNDIDDLIAYNTVINGLAQVGRFSEAIEVMNEFEAKGGRPSAETHTSIITAALAEEDMGRAWFFFRGMKRLGVDPLSTTYRAMIRGLTLTGQQSSLRDASELLLEMVRKFPTETGAIEFNTLMNGFAQVGDMNAVERLLERMIELDIKPDAITWTTVLSGHGKARNLSGVKRSFAALRASRGPVDLTSLNAFVSALVRCDEIDLAERVVDEMERVGGSIRPDLITYSVLIHAYLSAADAKRAWPVYERLKSSGIKPNQRLLEDILRLSIGQRATRGSLLGASQLRVVFRDMDIAHVPTWVIKRWQRKLQLGAKSLGSDMPYQSVKSKKPKASKEIFERHEWNEIQSGFRAF
ncbi:Pentatricopeptide repeat-containing protein [Porphyridium purpureum]|uniref:Pentatricopeptide repeat-containing protein n=1 Tax=Porphyridium purpureum TaxID=35688 RepID=A0A5J4Z316_PORPP|nr:Pentatricopeptide repeat-containing protein [Porphyridium purpureum]|eukprot:POR3161..scf295_1